MLSPTQFTKKGSSANCQNASNEAFYKAMGHLHGRFVREYENKDSPCYQDKKTMWMGELVARWMGQLSRARMHVVNLKRAISFFRPYNNYSNRPVQYRDPSTYTYSVNVILKPYFEMRDLLGAAGMQLFGDAFYAEKVIAHWGSDKTSTQSIMDKQDLLALLKLWGITVSHDDEAVAAKNKAVWTGDDDEEVEVVMDEEERFFEAMEA